MDIININTTLMTLLGLLFIAIGFPKHLHELQNKYYPNSSLLLPRLFIIFICSLFLFLTFEKIIVVYFIAAIGVCFLTLLLLVLERSLLFLNSLSFVIVAVILEIIGMRVFAEELVGFAFIALVISVFQDVLYEKIVNH